MKTFFAIVVGTLASLAYAEDADGLACEPGSTLSEETGKCVTCDTLPACENGGTRYAIGCICLEPGMLGSAAPPAPVTVTTNSCDIGTVLNAEGTGCVTCATLPACPNGNPRYPNGCICLEDGMVGSAAPPSGDEGDKPDGGEKKEDEGEGKTSREGDSELEATTDSAIKMGALAAFGTLSTAVLF